MSGTTFQGNLRHSFSATNQNVAKDKHVDGKVAAGYRPPGAAIIAGSIVRLWSRRSPTLQRETEGRAWCKDWCRRKEAWLTEEMRPMSWEKREIVNRTKLPDPGRQNSRKGKWRWTKESTIF
ncbi:uncharacterized protein LOC111266163 [Varroa jacobsoni]|uniref:uncharacterized protein LOC111266163 n=1 Tax=Varroa jacobsoni TaxID=62625 RepID=UPI000BF4A46D|nr:uncharacterized protein LOC111266163 [Varroa jacobsoni]